MKSNSIHKGKAHFKYIEIFEYHFCISLPSFLVFSNPSIVTLYSHSQYFQFVLA